MTKKEFVEKLKTLGVTLYEKVEGSKYDYDYNVRMGYKSLDPRDRKTWPDLEKLYLFAEWDMGGVSGGSCWDDGEGRDPHYAVGGDPEIELGNLDTVLEAFCPDINFLKYKMLVKEVQEVDTYCENEYYGNYTNYGIKTVSLKKLYTYLTEKDMLE